MFATRTQWPQAVNRLSQLAEARRRAGTLLDLSGSNPTRCGFDYQRPNILKALGQAAALRYDPDPRGLLPAREAVCGYYRDRGVTLTPDHLLLTASTSEAYSHLFRLLCNPGDEVLTPVPSYPLLDLLAEVNDVVLQPYAAIYDHGWHLEAAALEAAIGPRTRAILLVHPNNPTGAYIKTGAWAALGELARRRGLAVIVDEVFYDYAIAPAQAVALPYGAAPALTFVLNGLSKIAALPQMKLGWIAMFGPEELRGDALGRLEIINDTYLSVDAPIQHATGEMLGMRAGIQTQVRGRVAANLTRLDEALARLPGIERLALEGGWSAVVRLPNVVAGDGWAEYLVEAAGVLTHPGHFYGFAQEGCIVISLLAPQADFESGLQALRAAVAHRLSP